MSRCFRIPALWLAVATVAAPGVAHSHAALLEAETARAIRLHATYDTGAPMAEAQVLIYAPDDPAKPWGRGLTDAEGRFHFLPDGREGRWSVMVRQAGHGVMAHVEMGAGEPLVLTTAGATATTWGQRLLMIALVAWGALGTALFLWRGRRGRMNASS